MFFRIANVNCQVSCYPAAFVEHVHVHCDGLLVTGSGREVLVTCGAAGKIYGVYHIGV